MSVRAMLQAAAAAWRGDHREEKLAFCTVATRDFLPWAQVLLDSIERHHPLAQRVLLFVGDDARDTALPILAGVHVLAVRDLVDAASEAEMRRRFTRAELCFALKPPLLRHLLDRYGNRAIYLDSDISVEGPLTAAVGALKRQALVLTPHLDAPIPHDGKLPSEVTILRAGGFNLGFAGVADTPEARAILDWWQARVLRWGFVVPEAGYHGDQKLMDLAQAMFPAIGVLRDPGSNVGFWNLHSRRVERTPAGITVNGAPLAFFHFSGFDPARPAILSKYQNRFAEADIPLVMALAAEFARRIVAAGEAFQGLQWQPPLAVSPPQVSPGEAAMPGEAYRCRLEAEPVGGVFETEEELVIPVRVTNASGHRWAVAPVQRVGGIALTWHLCDAGGNVMVWDNPRTFLPRDLGPGESVDMRLGVRLPGKPGRYRIDLDLIHEGHAWFADRGNERPELPVLVGVFDAEERA